VVDLELDAVHVAAALLGLLGPLPFFVWGVEWLRDAVLGDGGPDPRDYE